jgi:hypothetical protein
MHQESGFARANLPPRARWLAKADAALRQPSGMEPSHLARVFLCSFFLEYLLTDWQTMIEDENLTVAQQQHLKQVRQKREELEKRMNFKAQPLSEEEQERFDAKFHNAQRMRRWVE